MCIRDRPEADRVHAFVAQGNGRIGDVDLTGGDAVRVQGETAREFRAAIPTQLLVWSFS